jgi:hypothetical protein
VRTIRTAIVSENLWEMGGVSEWRWFLAAGFESTVMDSVADELPFGATGTDVGLNRHVIPIGGLEHDKSTRPLNPEIGFTVTLNHSELPTGIVATVGDTDPEKLPPETTSCADALCDSGPLTPVILKL